MRGVTPALFVAHGAPSTVLDRDFGQALGGWAAARPRPRVIVALSAHAEADAVVRVNSALQPKIVHDFRGFPQELYELRYPAPGAPALASAIVSRLMEAGIEAALDRTTLLDHGVWVPLRLLFPAADVPVVALTLPSGRTPGMLLRMGAALAPLRESGILLLGSGGIVHNLRRLSWDDPNGPPEGWAQGFDAWFEERLAALDVAALEAYGERGPSAELAVPSSEHLDPVFFVLGSRGATDRVVTLYEGFRYGTLSLRSFALVPR